jgi:protein-tyrosine phosphatase
MHNILVVCEGNICRSPMAEGLLVSAALPQMQVRSAGLAVLSGMPPDETAVQLMRVRNVDITKHRATQLTREMCSQADLVLVMSTEQRKRLEERYPFACGRTFRLGDYSKRDIPDPYRQPEWAFRESLELIDQGVREWLRRIQKI